MGIVTSLHEGFAGQSGVRSSTGDFEIWLKVALEAEYLGNLEEGQSTGDFERLMKGSLGMELLSLNRFQWGGAPSLGSLEDMSRKSPDTAYLSLGAQFYPRGTWYLGLERLVYRGL